MRRVRRLVRLLGVGLTLAAISQEMSKPEAERTWHGKVFGVVPYDFRPPTWERLRASYWNPDDEKLFTDRVLGVGWAINFARAQSLLREGFEFLMGSAPKRQVTRKAGSKAG
jgi:hypothetical protein